MLESVSSDNMWVKLVPIKVNVFTWNMILDKLPIRLNLSKWGVDLPCLSCMICYSGVELVNHLFFSCPVEVDVLEQLLRWWGLDVPVLSSVDDWAQWFNGLTGCG